MQQFENAFLRCATIGKLPYKQQPHFLPTLMMNYLDADNNTNISHRKFEKKTKTLQLNNKIKS